MTTAPISVCISDGVINSEGGHLGAHPKILDASQDDSSLLPLINKGGNMFGTQRNILSIFCVVLAILISAGSSATAGSKAFTYEEPVIDPDILVEFIFRANHGTARPCLRITTNLNVRE